MGRSMCAKNANELNPLHQSTLSMFIAANSKNCFSFALIRIPYSKQISDFPFSLSRCLNLTLIPSFSHFCHVFLLCVWALFAFSHFLGATWCLGVWFFWILFAFIAVARLANFSMTHRPEKSEREETRTRDEEKNKRAAMLFGVASVFVVGSVKMLHKIVEIMIVLLIESVLSVIGQFSKNVIHMRLSN